MSHTTSPYAVSHHDAPSANGAAPPTYLAMESLPIVVPWPIMGSTEPMRVVYRLDRVMDLASGRLYQDLMASFIADETRIDGERTALRALDPQPADLEAQLIALGESIEANNAAGYLHLLTHTVTRVLMPPGVPPVADPADPAAWAVVHPAIRAWLATLAFTEVRSQLAAPFQRSGS